MTVNYKYIILCTMCSFLLVSCGPKKEEEKPLSPPEQGEQKSDTLLSYPNNEDLEKQKEGQLPSKQEEELQIDEDNVMNPLPG